MKNQLLKCLFSCQTRNSKIALFAILGVIADVVAFTSNSADVFIELVVRYSLSTKVLALILCANSDGLEWLAVCCKSAYASTVKICGLPQ